MPCDQLAAGLHADYVVMVLLSVRAMGVELLLARRTDTASMDRAYHALAAAFPPKSRSLDMVERLWNGRRTQGTGAGGEPGLLRARCSVQQPAPRVGVS